MDLGPVVVSVVTGVFGCIIVWLQVRNGSRIKTNHGKTIGQHIESLGDTVAQIQRTMVTQQDLAEHAAHDIAVADDLRKEGRETRDILLAAIRVEKQ